MDITPSLLQGLTAVIVNYWYLVPILFLLALFKSNRFKGFVGECFVTLLIRLALSKHTYHLINNVTLPTETGTTQIDHIIVSKFGIFVIETKHLRGWIFGSANQKQWTQKIFKHTNKFQNPLHQNYKHLKTIEQLLEVPMDALFSLIVFVGECTFKTDLPENVTHSTGCVRFIKSKKEAFFTDQEVEAFVSAINSGRLKPGLKTNHLHTRHVQDLVSQNNRLEKSTSIEITQCHRCDAPMILREATQGSNTGKKFWGCSNYPKCTAVINIP